MDNQNVAGQNSSLENTIQNVAENRKHLEDLRDYELTKKSIKEFTNTNLKEQDVINHPSHYNQYEGFEVIDVCEQLRAPDGRGGFNRGEAFKFLARAGWKDIDKHVEDLEKAKFYIQREIDRIQSDNWMKASPTLAELKEVLHSPNDGCGEKSPRLDPIGAYHCPDCGINLMPDFSCPNEHGWLKFSSDSVLDEPVWMPPKSAEYKSSHICPECGAGLVAYAIKTDTFYCPHDHGWLVITPMGNGGGKWHPPMTTSTQRVKKTVA